MTAKFKDFGATLVAISPQQEVYNRQLIEERKLTFQILSDPGNKVAQQYGLKFGLPDDLKQVYLQFGIKLPEFNGDDSWTLPLPARLIIDQNGVIQYAEINADYAVRPEPEETIAALQSIL